MCGLILLSFVPRANFFLISNVFDKREKVARGRKLSRTAHGELSVELAGTSNFCSADSSRVRQALYSPWLANVLGLGLNMPWFKQGRECSTCLFFRMMIVDTAC